MMTSVTSDFKIPDAFIQPFFNVSGYPTRFAQITPIHKGKGSLNFEANYSPISVLSHVVKIFEKRV